MKKLGKLVFNVIGWVFAMLLVSLRYLKKGILLALFTILLIAAFLGLLTLAVSAGSVNMLLGIIVGIVCLGVFYAVIEFLSDVFWRF